MNVQQYLQNKLAKIVAASWPIVKEQPVDFEVSYPPDDRFGHYSANIAMKLASVLRRKPMDVAEDIIAQFGRSPAVSKVEAVQPGFINFYLNEKWLLRQVTEILKQKKRYGKSVLGKGKRVQVEFISANPTGPLHIGNGRGGFAGDTLANILKLAGYTVQREYYVNDMGKQVSVLAESVLRRYWKHNGITIEYPDYCYQGKYIDELAKKLFLPNYKLGNSEKLEVVREKIKGRILQRMISSIKKLTDKNLGIKFDRWYSEKSLYTSGVVDKLLEELKNRGLLYKSEGAIWLRTKRFGDDKDRVLIKANEEPVYFLSDVAYHWEKFIKRKFDIVIDILGADHHGYIGRLQAVMKMFHFESRLDVIIVQLVRLIHEGKEVKMSKRSGTFVTLEELIDEVGIDAARFFFLMYDFNTHMDFDLDLAKKQTKDNPVYYVQYAHARICSIMRKTKGLKLTKSDRRAVIEKSEVALLKTLIKWPELVVDISGNYQVNKLPYYAIEVATKFHDFYTKCRVINGKQVNERRLHITNAAQTILQNVLSVMGIRAPQRM